MKEPAKPKYGIHWFRRDLRVAGNPGLEWNWKEHHGKMVGLFCFDHKFLSRSDFSPNRFAFFLETLKELKAELKSIGSDLLVLDVGPQEAFGKVFSLLQNQGLPHFVTFNRDYEPFALSRDKAMELWLTQHGVHVHHERDHLLIEPHEISKDNKGGFYQVFTPYSKRWFEKLRTPEVRARIHHQQKGLEYLRSRAKGKIQPDLFSLSWQNLLGKSLPEDHLENYIQKNRSHVTVPIPPAGSIAALARLDQFQDRLPEYQEQRDFPAVDGTSRLSIYLKNGSLTSAQVIAALGLESCQLSEASGRVQFLKEIIWREFYYAILFHCPRVEKEAFLTKYNTIEWENREDRFQAWIHGKTGYPIVDAGMRQLRDTGWMHNRVRMIVASFLTKDLLVSWQWGEAYFMKMLLDGDLAPNNGGWQWAASTGCDPQPYFRIFNPTLQSERFDPEGHYIRKYVPELKNLSHREIHQPQNPIVDHTGQKVRALALYQVN